MSDIVEKLRAPLGVMQCGERDMPDGSRQRFWLVALDAADTITALRDEVEDLGNRLHHVHRLWANNEHALRAEVERLKVESIQMQDALGYAILAEDERHILPSNPFKCGTCDASKRLRAENEKLRAALEEVRALVLSANHSETRYPLARAALSEPLPPEKEPS